MSKQTQPPTFVLWAAVQKLLPGAEPNRHYVIGCRDAQQVSDCRDLFLSRLPPELKPKPSGLRWGILEFPQLMDFAVILTNRTHPMGNQYDLKAEEFLSGFLR